MPKAQKKLAAPTSKRVIADLRELAKRTSTERGAQRVAWGPVWREARAWFTEKVKHDLGLEVETDPAGNAWVTLPGASKDSVVFGSHLDSVPGGGWLDGVLGVVAGIEVLRRHQAAGTPPVTAALLASLLASPPPGLLAYQRYFSRLPWHGGAAGDSVE
jgi:N-carbamoyl-L-amino-acid hydrolase